VTSAKTQVCRASCGGFARCEGEAEAKKALRNKQRYSDTCAYLQRGLARARARKKKKKKERKRRRKKEEKERSRERRKIPGETGLASRSPYRLFTSRYLRQVLRNGFTSPFPYPVPRNVQERFIERDIEIPLGCFFKSISSLGILDESGAIVSSSDVRAELFIAKTRDNFVR